MSFQLPQTIDEVILQLENIIQAAIQNEDPMGLFPTLYRIVTIKVKEGIHNGFFEAPDRMEQLDVVFANRYLEAYHQYQNELKPTLSWQLAFEGTQKDQYLMMQHLLLGINAHINLDLGIAAARVAPGPAIQSLKSDFDQINAILFQLVDATQDIISELSPWFGVLDWIGQNTDERFAQFSLKAARLHAWTVAQQVAECPLDEQAKLIDRLDYKVQKFGTLIIRPGRFLDWVLGWIHWWEEPKVSKQIEILNKIA